MSYSPRSVSVCLPTYNRADFIGKAIESVLAQSYTDFELLVVDNCSTDRTAEVVAAYAAQDPRIRSLRNETNLGMVGNFNRCLELARCDLIKFLCSDDYFADSYCLERFVAAMEDDSVALAACARQVVDRSGRVAEILRPLSAGRRGGRDIARQCLIDLKNRIGEPTAVIFRKRFAARGFDPQFYQLMDFELWLHLLQFGDFYYIEEPLVAFTLHQEQISQQNRRALSGLKDDPALIARYVTAERFSFPGAVDRLLRLAHCRQVWKSYTAGLASAEEARRQISGVMSYPLFRLLNSRYPALRRIVKALERIS